MELLGRLIFIASHLLYLQTLLKMYTRSEKIMEKYKIKENKIDKIIRKNEYLK